MMLSSDKYSASSSVDASSKDTEGGPWLTIVFNIGLVCQLFSRLMDSVDQMYETIPEPKVMMLKTKLHEQISTMRKDLWE